MSVKRNLRLADQRQRGSTVTKSGKMRKKTEKRDTPKANASDAVLQSDSTAVKRTSRKINYGALLSSFDADGNFIAPISSAAPLPATSSQDVLFPLDEDSSIALGSSLQTASQTFDVAAAKRARVRTVGFRSPPTSASTPVDPTQAQLHLAVMGAGAGASRTSQNQLRGRTVSKGNAPGRSSLQSSVPALLPAKSSANPLSSARRSDADGGEENEEEEDDEEDYGMEERGFGRDRGADDYDEEYF